MADVEQESIGNPLNPRVRSWLPNFWSTGVSSVKETEMSSRCFEERDCTYGRFNPSFSHLSILNLLFNSNDLGAVVPQVEGHCWLDVQRCLSSNALGVSGL